MNDKTAGLLTKIAEAEAKGQKFAEVKHQLLALGFTEQQISHAVYAARYDGKPNTKPQDPHAAAFAADPETTQQIAESILDDQRQRDRQELVANGLASRAAPGLQGGILYEAKVFEQLGLPYFKISLVGLLLFGLIMYFRLPLELLYAYGAFVTLWIIKETILFFRKKQ